MNTQPGFRIVTHTAKGSVTTFYADDPFHSDKGWNSFLAVWEAGMPIQTIVKMLVSDTLDQAGVNHLDLCKEI